MDEEVKYFLEKWAQTYFKFVTLLSIVGVFITCLVVPPGEAALYLMTMNEIKKI